MCGHFDFNFDCLEYFNFNFDFNMTCISIISISISIVETRFLQSFFIQHSTNKLNHYLNRPLGQAYSQQQPNYQFDGCS